MEKKQKKKYSHKKNPIKILGWREWVGLPDLGIKRIKAKIDTGAHTSSLHVSHLKFYKRENKKFLEFKIHPRQKKRIPTIKAHAELLGIRKIKSSTGHITLRPVVTTRLQIGEDVYPIELNLFNRDMMGFRMLLGRQAIRHKYVVHPHHSYLTGNKPVKKN